MSKTKAVSDVVVLLKFRDQVEFAAHVIAGRARMKRAIAIFRSIHTARHFSLPARSRRTLALTSIVWRFSRRRPPARLRYFSSQIDRRNPFCRVLTGKSGRGAGLRCYRRRVPVAGSVLVLSEYAWLESAPRFRVIAMRSSGRPRHQSSDAPKILFACSFRRRSRYFRIAFQPGEAAGYLTQMAQSLRASQIGESSPGATRHNT